MGGWFNKKIQSPKDFKGLKIRMPGLGGEVLRELGATVVTVPGGEVFQSLKSGAIDASEWLGPYNDLAFGLHQAAKYYYWPGWHEPGTTIEAFVNDKALKALPARLQTTLRLGCEVASQHMISEFNARNSEALETLKKKHQIKLEKFTDETLKSLKENSEKVLNAIVAKDPFSRRVYDSYQSFQKKSAPWVTISEQGYSLARQL